MKLPTEIASEMTELAEKEYPTNWIRETDESIPKKHAFANGFQACFDLLMRAGKSFWDVYDGKAEVEFTEDREHLSIGEKAYIRFGFETGAKHMHSLMSPQVAARDAQMAELEEELSLSKAETNNEMKSFGYKESVRRIAELETQLNEEYVLNAKGAERELVLINQLQIAADALKEIENVASAFQETRKQSYADFELRMIARKALEKMGLRK
jgi:hypothetical protein